MDNRNSRINQILAHLAGAATVAAGGVSDVMSTAGKAVSNKYDSVKVGIELSRLQEEQQNLFADIGRTMYKIKSGTYEVGGEDDAVDGQQMVDKLLFMADQKQQEIDLAVEKLGKLTGNKICPTCGKVCDVEDIFCSACGAKLPVEEPVAEAPEETTEAPEQPAEKEPVEKDKKEDKK